MKNLFDEEIIDEYCEDSDFWQTPPDLYKSFMRDNTWFDPCPVNPNFDGLSIPWHGNVFCNPPYSQISTWIDKAWKESNNTSVNSITMLLPNWTDREWFECISICEIKFLRGRLKFVDPNTGLPGKDSPRFGSMLVTIK